MLVEYVDVDVVVVVVLVSVVEVLDSLRMLTCVVVEVTMDVIVVVEVIKARIVFLGSVVVAFRTPLQAQALRYLSMVPQQLAYDGMLFPRSSKSRLLTLEFVLSTKS